MSVILIPKGSIPAEIGNLTTLTDLNLRWNRLSGKRSISIIAIYGKSCMILNLFRFDPRGDRPPDRTQIS
jgi:hypothetical protein